MVIFFFSNWVDFKCIYYIVFLDIFYVVVYYDYKLLIFNFFYFIIVVDKLYEYVLKFIYFNIDVSFL